MERKISSVLLKWKEDFKMPLMVMGPRQIGKTYTLTEFCEKYFENYIYINLEKEEEVRQIFESTLDPDKILESIEILKGISFNVENTILFLDEIQVSERAITSLKYFCESEKPYKVVCAGSLLGVKINRFSSSFPVGKVILKYMYPLNFEEFLLANGEDKLIDLIKEHYITNEPIINSVHDYALDLYKKYLVLGGMPQVINDFINKDKKITDVNFELQDYVITSYLADMSKYTENSEAIKNNKIYNSIPKELARVNNIFKFSLVEKDARSARYKNSLNWLIDSNMILKCDLATKNESPLTAYKDENTFKIYLNDVGLLRSLSNIHYSEILLDKNEMFKGALTENYVASEFNINLKELYFYKFNKYEIDFLIKLNGDVIPVEVKSGVRTGSKSLNEYIEKYNSDYAIRISSKNFGLENNIKSVPLYAVFCIK